MATETKADDRILTADEFWELPEEEGYRLELSRGRVVREPAPGMRHGQVAGRLYRRLWRHVEREGRGLVFFDTAFALTADLRTVRVPDVAFLSQDRIPEGGLSDRFGEGAPDLAVEVVSPSNRASEIQRKALEYLDAGARLVWVVDPAERTVAVYRSRSDIRILGDQDVLEGDPVISDLRMPVGELFR